MLTYAEYFIQGYQPDSSSYTAAADRTQREEIIVSEKLISATNS